jgi:PAS domain S-box-containing protein
MSPSEGRRPPHVLVVDDDALQLKLSVLRLKDAGFRVTTASGAAAALDRALADVPDVIFSDVLMGDTDGFGLCRRIREQATLANVPIVLASAHYWDEKAHALATRVGASALVGRTPEFETELKTLANVLERGVPVGRSHDTDGYEEHLRMNADQISRLLGEAKSAEERYRTLFESAHDAIAVLNQQGIVLEVNQRWSQLVGGDVSGVLGRHLLDLAAHGRETSAVELGAVIGNGAGVVHGVAIARRDGSIAYVDLSISSVDVQSQPLVLAIGRDVTGQLLAARELARAEEKYRSLIERLPDVVMTTTRESSVFATSNVERITGFSPNEVYAMDARAWLERIHVDDAQHFATAMYRQVEDAAVPSFDVEYRFRHKQGHWLWLAHRVIACYERNDARYFDSLISDISRRKQLEEGLRQAQKMEAVGQLSGGIAHDFNNILATILANSEFLIEELGENDARCADAKEIKLGAERAAGLTRQLLAFSRRQVLELRIAELNPIIANIEKMLRRLIGEDIQLDVRLAQDLGSVQIDQGQIEQVLLNLAVNARDAMPRGGRLLIETSNIEIEPTQAAGDTRLGPGRYVMFSVTDTGAGMDLETQQRIFEPFFTTKEQGKGTGLGLATCHGIVSQCGGCIGVESELGRGTVFKVYLPRVDESPSPLAPRPSLLKGLRGDEGILLVEDDVPLRAAIRRMLTGCGYRIIVAKDVTDAMSLAKARANEITLILVDVVMPGMSGPELATAILEVLPAAKILFMSGYTDHAALLAGLDAVHFIQKPFSPQALARKVRQTLDLRATIAVTD